MRGGDDLRHVGGEVVEAAVLDADSAVAVAEHEAAEAVPLDLEEVVGGAEGSLGRGGLHRPQLGREALELDLKLVWIRHVMTPRLSEVGPSPLCGELSVRRTTDASPRKWGDD